MKKQIIFKTLFAIFAIMMIIGLSSCGGKKANKPDCEKNNTADVVLTNNSDYVLHVDVVYNSSNTNEDRTLQIGQSTTYTMTAGIVYIQASNPTDYASRPTQYWIEENFPNGTKLTQCQIYKLSWTTENTTAKGSNGNVQK